MGAFYCRSSLPLVRIIEIAYSPPNRLRPFYSAMNRPSKVFIQRQIVFQRSIQRQIVLQRFIQRQIVLGLSSHFV